MTKRVSLCLLVIVSGLALRGFGRDIGLPSFIVKYGGSVLWGTMVLLLAAIFLPSRSPTQVTAIAMTIAVCVELSRLIHTPWLDAFRLTMPGALLLGRIFSPWDILAYAVGIALGAVPDRGVGSAVRP
jgi:hypothetical protein